MRGLFDCDSYSTHFGRLHCYVSSDGMTILMKKLLRGIVLTVFSLLFLSGCGDEAPKKTETPAKACGDIAGSKSCWYVAEAEIAVPGLLQNWLSQVISGCVNVTKNL